MEDEGVVLGAALGLKYMPHRFFIQGVGSQTVHRFRGDAQQPAAAEDPRRLPYFIFPIFGVKNPCFQITSFFTVRDRPRSEPP